jgi:hypothetical protein
MFTFVILLLPAQAHPPSVAEAVDRSVREQSLPQRIKRRDEALKRVGRNALGFLQEYGETGVEALLRSEPETGKRLLALHQGGALGKLAHADLLVALIAERGEEVGAWAVRNHEKLTGPNAMRAFLDEPLEFVHGLKALPADPPAPDAQREPAPWRRYWREGLLAVGLPLMFLLGRWRRKTRREPARATTGAPGPAAEAGEVSR